MAEFLLLYRGWIYISDAQWYPYDHNLYCILLYSCVIQKFFFFYAMLRKIRFFVIGIRILICFYQNKKTTIWIRIWRVGFGSWPSLSFATKTFHCSSTTQLNICEIRNISTIPGCIELRIRIQIERIRVRSPRKKPEFDLT